MWGGDKGGCGTNSLSLIQAASRLMAEFWPIGTSSANAIDSALLEKRMS